MSIPTDSEGTSHYEVEGDWESVFSFVYDRGWTDGLPVIPPTPDKVRAMLSGSSLSADTVVAELEPRRAPASIEKLAINAVMAGCLPSYMPSIVAAVRALADPAFNLNGIQCTTNPVAPLLIINGPVRQQLTINCGRNALGQGTRANATIGRCIRLVLQNVGGGTPGEIDKAIHGLPAKYSFCFGEDEENSPWRSLHAERGFAPYKSAVTAIGPSSMVNCLMNIDPDPSDPRPNLRLLADALSQKASNNIQLGGGSPLFILPSHFAEGLDTAGWNKDDVKRFLWSEASFPAEELPSEMRFAPGHPKVIDGRIYSCDRPEDLVIVVAGGPEPYHVLYLPNFGENRAVTVALEE